jgi:adenylate cyclase
MRRLLSVFAPLWVLLAVLLLRVFDPAPVEQIRNLVFDTYQQIEERPYDPRLPVRIVAIDDESLARLGQWPWPRTLVARLVDRLAAAGAAVIAFDVVFAEPDRSSPERVLPSWPATPEVRALRDSLAALPSHDGVLAEAMGRARVVTGFVLTNGAATSPPAVRARFALAGDDPKPFVPSFTSAVTNLGGLEAAALGNGAFNPTPDRDQVMRRIPLVLRLGESLYPTLAVEALRVAQGAATNLIKSSGASGVLAFGAHTGISAVRIGQSVIPTDRHGRLLAHFTESTPARYIPAWQVLEPGFEAERVAGRIVFVGTNAPGLFDMRATARDPAVPGVEIHAQVVEQILSGAFLHRPDFATGAELAYMLVLGLALVFLLPRYGATPGLLLGLAATVVVIGGSWLAYDRRGWLFDPVFPTFVVVFVFLSSTVISFLRSEAQRRQVRGAFSRYMSPALVEQLCAHPERLKLGGEMREMTLLFCDIRGFTTISEQFDAEGLTGFINRFLTPMTAIILEARGTIDKYMGDCIMAFWNAPLDDPHHARHACRAALDMMAGLAELNDEWRVQAERDGKRYFPVEVGVGLNTGPCCVGNMGSEQRFDYSVLGDDVNLASRLEGQTKAYGLDIILGENTRAEASDFATLEVDLIRVKGKTRPVRIYALLGDEVVESSEAFQALAARHRDFLDTYRAGQWQAAGALLADCRASAGAPLEALYALYGERLEAYREDPPPADWDGVYVAKTK